LTCAQSVRCSYWVGSPHTSSDPSYGSALQRTLQREKDVSVAEGGGVLAIFFFQLGIALGVFGGRGLFVEKLGGASGAQPPAD
jgi:hypothetical protein